MFRAHDVSRYLHALRQICDASGVAKYRDQISSATLHGLGRRVVDTILDTRCCVLFPPPRLTILACHVRQTPKQQTDLTHH